jgi:hypothetical protein
MAIKYINISPSKALPNLPKIDIIGFQSNARANSVIMSYKIYKKYTAQVGKSVS